VLAALQKLVEHVIVGRVADQRIDGYGFCERGKIAHAGSFS
jgi:hypothetical protein